MAKRRAVVAAGAVVAVIAGGSAAILLRSDESTPPARSEVVSAEVTGIAAPGWKAGMQVVVDSDGRAWQLVGATERVRIGTSVTARGSLLPADQAAPDVVRLTVAESSSAAGAAVAAPLRVVGRSGTVAVEASTDVAGRLHVDGDTDASPPVVAGRTNWDTRTVRNGAHLLTVVTQKRIVALGWSTVANSGSGDRIPGRIAFGGDYETGNLRQWDLLQAVSPERARAVTAPVRDGRFAARFEVRQGEDPIGSSGPRAELTRRTNEQEGDERWYAWSTMFAPDFPVGEGWQVITQWHADAEGSPPVGIYVQDGRLELQVNRHDGPGEQLSTEVPYSGPLKRGQWRDIRLHVIWSGDDAKGLVQMFVDGVEVVPATRIRTLYPGIGNYLKQGYYRDPAIAEPGVLYHDAMRMSIVRGGDPEPLS